MENKITYDSFFRAVAECLKEENIVYMGPLGQRDPLPTDLMSFKQWNKLAERLGLEKPKTIVCEGCGREK